MKRNMDLIKEILIFIEEKYEGIGFVPIDPQYLHETDWKIIQEHCRMIVERGLATGRLIDTQGWSFDSLTWDGHDFLDNARNSTVWEITKRAAGKLSFGVFRKVLEESATAFALTELGKIS